jgi:hypothetical protein
MNNKMKKNKQKPQSTKVNQKSILEQEEQYYQSVAINQEKYLAKRYWSGEDCERLFFVNEVALENRRTRKQKNFLESLTDAINTGELINLNKHTPTFNKEGSYSSTLHALFDPAKFKSWINHPKTKKYFNSCEIKIPNEVSIIFNSIKSPLKSSGPPGKKGRKASPLKDLVKKKAFEIFDTKGAVSIKETVDNVKITRILAPNAPQDDIDKLKNDIYLKRYSIPRRTVYSWIQEAKSEFFHQ